MSKPSSRLILGALAALALGGYLTLSGAVGAADHNDPVRVQVSGPTFPGNTFEVHPGDPAGDLADLFAWHTKDSLVCVLTWRTDAADPRLDPQLVYGIHIDNDVDFNPADPADIDIWIRYAQNPSGQWGQKVEGLPGVGTVVSRVGDEANVGGIRMLTGLFDDPFVFDLDGFFNGLSVALGNEAPAEPSLLTDRPFGFDNENDSFAGTNVGAFVIELPLSSVRDQGSELHLWATSRALPGRPRGK